MHGGIGPKRVARICAALSAGTALLWTGACAGAQADPGPALPTFTAATPPMAAAPGRDPDGTVPDDCEHLLAVADLGALLGLPLDSVGVRTTIGVPAPAVGRTERVACQYSGAIGGPIRGQMLLGLNASSYVDAAAATKQWRTNVDAEPGERREMPIGTASAVLVERKAEAVLLVAHGSGNLTVVLPEGPRPGGISRADLARDLALRVLPSVAATGPVPQPAQAVGAAS